MVVNNNVTVLVAVTEAAPEDTLAPPAAAGIAAAALNIKKRFNNQTSTPLPSPAEFDFEAPFLNSLRDNNRLISTFLSVSGWFHIIHLFMHDYLPHSTISQGLI